MKPLRVLLPLAVLAVAGGFLYSTLRSRSAADAFRLERAQLKRELVERASVLRQLPASRAREAREEARALLRWYFDELSAMRGRHPSYRPEPQGDRLRAKEGDREGAQEWQRYAEERFRALREGTYDPVLTSADQGLRLDLLAVEAGENPATRERAVRIDFALWGAPRRVEREPAAGGSRTSLRVVVPATFRQISFRFSDAAGKPYGEMTGPGEPYLKLADPERFVEDFPPGLVLGTWWVDLFPREAARVEIGVAAQVHGMTAAEVAASFRLEAPVQEAWKIREGEAYRAQTRVEAPATPPAR